MDLARYVVDAVVLEGRSYWDVALADGVSKSWVGKTVGRFRQGGYEALEPRSHAPHSIDRARRGAHPHALRPPRCAISDEPRAISIAIPDRNAPPDTALTSASGSSASQTWKIATIARKAT